MTPMKKFSHLFFLLTTIATLLFSSTFAEDWLSSEIPQEKNSEYFQHQCSLNNLTNNVLLTKSIQKAIAPYLLPSNSPIANILNPIFSSSRPTFNSSTLEQAGFQILHKQPRSYIIVARHPAVPGYLFKMYYDSDVRIKNNVPGWKWFVRRCAGAKLIRKVIDKKR